MKIVFSKIAACFMVANVFFSACQDSEIVTLDKSDTDSMSCTYDNDFSIIRVGMKGGISKGYMMDHTEDIETGEAFLGENVKKVFKTMKVYRQSDPSKYFYIMLTNLDVPYPIDDYLLDTMKVSNNLCGPYGGDYSNLKEYGLLYNQYSAEQMCNYIFMKVPWYDKKGKPVIKNGKQRTRIVKGRFMKTPDLADLLECQENEIMKVGLHGVSEYLGDPEKSCYYNAFVFGLDACTSESGAYHSLGGHKDKYNMDYAEDRNQWRKDNNMEHFPDDLIKQIWTNYYEEINHSGYYWMAPQEKAPRMLSIYRNSLWSENEDWVAAWLRANYIDGHYSVRLVFDPFE